MSIRETKRTSLQPFCIASIDNNYFVQIYFNTTTKIINNKKTMRKLLFSKHYAVAPVLYRPSRDIIMFREAL